MKNFFPLALLLLLAACADTPKEEMTKATAYPPIPVTYPSTEKVDHVDTYHGTEVPDAFRWLEDDNAEATKAWVTEQNKTTFGYLDQIPFRKAIADRLTELVNYPRVGAPSKVGNYYIWSKNDGLQNQSVYYYKEGENGEEKVLIDPNTLNAEGTTSIGLLGADKSKRYMAYSRSEAGSDWNKIYVRDLQTNTDLPDELEWIKFGGAGWYKDGFFYSRYPAPAPGEALKGNNTMHSVYYHKLGDPQSKDVLIYEDKGNPSYYHYGGTTEEEDYFVLYAAPGTDGFAMYYLPLDGKTIPVGKKPIALFPETTQKSSLVHTIGKDFYVHTDVGAPRYRLVKINIDQPAEENWTEILPEGDNLLQGVNTGGGYFFANYLEKATDRYYQMNYDGSNRKAIELPGLGSAGGFSGREEEKKLYYTFTSFTYPATIFEYDVETGESRPFFAPDLKFTPADFEESQITYTSKDGTPVTMFLVHKKGLKLDGTNPTYLYGYGGFNINMSPGFSAFRIPMLENGAVFAMANLRGGGEYGEEWHQAGMLKNKQNVFDDFIAAGEWLIEKGYTSKEKLAIAGGSNGGLLVGAAMTQRPDLFAVAFPAVGVMDMLRYHEFTVGKGWIPEYGSSADPEMFPILRAYSPLHNLKDGTAYPATMVTTADHDDRVVPAHSFKFAARLQEAHAGEKPVLIRVAVDAGHGAGKPISKTIEEQADIWSFFFYNTNSPVKYGVEG
ncbi:prolyl oligopeptidase family serine peptidase [Neolewinella lacunae]|uniref:prolyl oligopeptidase n=1 Tax=Neolewinella lacunae TaxID=1517758 RepID=A0A923T906_9BACT|nr:prolyl oligopeptidase family serine peptidase [Neolewinella lacunae]MBC6994543.1 S9 family peptidase [Neolewinella lacunae]MDN3634236.1 prolyl oligopeptidase family serine peptidase [Neolewinella lacunae]